MKSKVHPTYKTKYRVANWAAYNQALVRRGDVRRCCMNTLWGWESLARTSRDPPQEPHYRDAVEGSIPRTRRSTALRTGRPITKPSFAAAL